MAAPFSAVLALTVAGWACSRAPQRVQVVDHPAGPASAEPFLAASSDRLVLSWLHQPENGPPALRMALAAPDGAGLRWSPPRTVIEDERLFVNWADFPSVTPLGGGTLAAHWLLRTADSPYAYHVLFSTSDDDGATWSPAVRPHRDLSPAEHGFVSVVADPAQPGAAGVVWLDGRRMLSEAPDTATQLMFARWNGSSFEDEQVLDPRVCDCCQTAALQAADRLLVAYRDRTDEEIRDISLVAQAAEDWTTPRPLNDDGWRINGCPVNGPAMDHRADVVAAAWFTGVGEPRVQAAFSDNAGRSFGEPVRVDDGVPIGRVDVVMLDGSSAVVTWIETLADGRAEVRARVVRSDGRLESVRAVGPTQASRAAGFPRAVLWREAVWVAWTVPQEDGSTIRLARLDL